MYLQITGNSSNSTYGTNHFIRLTSKGSDLLSGVSSIGFLKNGAANSVGETIGLIQYNGRPNSSADYEFARTSAVVRNITGGVRQMLYYFKTAIGGVITPFLEVNGAENQIKAYCPLDMSNNSIVTSTGNITIDGSTSTTGATQGYIYITPKPGSYIILSNLPTNSSGLPTGALYNSAGFLKVAP